MAVYSMMNTELTQVIQVEGVSALFRSEHVFIFHSSPLSDQPITQIDRRREGGKKEAFVVAAPTDHGIKGIWEIQKGSTKKKGKKPSDSKKEIIAIGSLSLPLSPSLSLSSSISSTRWWWWWYISYGGGKNKNGSPRGYFLGIAIIILLFVFPCLAWLLCYRWKWVRTTTGTVEPA